MSKAMSGKTNKYSGLVKNIQSKQPQQPEEPKITQEEVISAFHSFGFSPNERNHNDIGYWTLKGKSELHKLMEDLHKRRMDINQQEDDQKNAQDQAAKDEQAKAKQHHESKQTLPRLSDQELAALYDEYGLPAPDPEWARTHLPNDPNKVRSILDMQRKHADDMLKKHAKNTVNSMPEVQKNQPMSMPNSPMMGQGGPTPMDMQGGMVGDEGPKTPFFIGDHSIVRITNPTNPQASTTWLVDAKKKVLRPFLSDQSFKNAFENPDEAEKAVVTISIKELGPGGALEGFKPLKGDQGVKDDGSMDNIPFTEGQLQNRYGKQDDPVATNKALSMLDGLYGQMKNHTEGVPQDQGVTQGTDNAAGMSGGGGGGGGSINS